MRNEQRGRFNQLRDYFYNWNVGDEVANSRVAATANLDELIILLGEIDQDGSPAWASAIEVRHLLTELYQALDRLDNDLRIIFVPQTKPTR